MPSTNMFVLQMTQHMWAQSQDPISFYDIFLLTREAEQLDPVERATLEAMYRLALLPHLTDGAREMLQAYLSAVAAHHKQERARGAAGVGLKEHNKRVRIALGETLSIQLKPQIGHPGTWLAPTLDGLQISVPPASQSGYASTDARPTFVCVAHVPGTYRLDFTEQPRLRASAAKSQVASTMKLRRLTFWLTVD